MTDLGIGKPVRRVEDARLLRGRGQFTDDIDNARAAIMHIVRSPHASARILNVDAEAARRAPGVLAVLTGAEALQEKFNAFPSRVLRHRPDGRPNYVPPYLPLAVDRAPHAGDAVVAVIAETLNQAKDAAELVHIDYEPLPAVTDAVSAARQDAPVVWPDNGDNICFLYRLGDRKAANAAFARAAHRVQRRFVISRMAAMSMEPRNAIGHYDTREDRYTVEVGTLAPHGTRAELAGVFGVPENRVRVVSPDVGGAFGMKNGVYQEYVLVLWAARLTGRTVKWMSDRSEAFLSDHQSRDNVSDVSLALDEDGKFLALRVETIANIGGYISASGLHSPTNNLGGLAGVYKIPAFDIAVTGVFSNTLPICPFRGAGRPEASYCIERIVAAAAEELRMDPVALRRRNMIPEGEMPFDTGLVYTYDSGAFETVMDKCLAASDWSGFEKRRRESEKRGRLRGRGLAYAIEIAGGPPTQPLEEAVEIRFDTSGNVTVLAGTHSHGQGHETSYRQLAAEFLGLPFDKVRVSYGDTDAVFHGRGSFGSRSMMAGGAAFLSAADKIIAHARDIAAHMMEAAPGDIEFKDGTFTVAGTDRSIDLIAIAQTAFQAAQMPKGMELGLQANAVVSVQAGSFPNGCHVCEVEIDPETGVARIVAYCIVDDVGRVINPLLLKGQIHGGIAQGAGQALMEQISYDESGQIVSGSFMDYALPRAHDFPDLDVHSHAVPATTNPLGVKGAGEAGAVGALPAVMNAVQDALRPLGVTHIDMPASPHNVWRAIRSARTGRS
ncbi:MAG: xanthine dehydrogenase family protein molybdopterin-binding subunit [Pseudorhodoplanes sp.]